ncbi:MAG: LCP family protein [Acidimicrobiia bacterium]
MSERTPPRDTRKVHIPAPGSTGTGAGRAAPGSARPGGTAASSARRATGGATAGPARSPSGARSSGPARTAPGAGTAGRPGAPAGAGSSRRRRRLPRRPKLRRVLLLTSLFLPLLLLLVLLGGWLYARSVYDRVEKIPLADVLSDGGSGTNYLIVGSDSRSLDDLVGAGLNPEAFGDGGGQRSDTMLLLRFQGGEAKMMSIPRDLYVPIAETGGSSKINAAYNGGPRRLVLTVQQSLGLPVHHYLEVDFVSFARLVDALGGITIDFEHPAYDRSSGLQIDQAGPNQLDGPMALAYVRSRSYVEIIDGQPRPDPTADLGRVQRQQRFLSAVFSELGRTKNPLSLARAASSASGGVRVDDTLGLLDAIRLGWRLRSLDPTPVELPVRNGTNEAGAVLFLVDPDAQAALDQFR